MRRNYGVVLLIVIMMFLLTACGKDGVNEKQIKADIISKDEIQKCYVSQFVGDARYVIKEYNLIKEQFNKENKEDIIFCELVLDNEYFEVKINADIVYNFYDKGGWIMDELSVEVVEVNPIKEPDIEEVLTYIKNAGYEEEISCYYDGEVMDVKNGKLTGVNSVYNASEKSAQMYCEYKTATLEMTGWFEMNFEKNEWVIKNTSLGLNYLVLIMEDYTADYSMALGEFVWEPRYANLLSTGKLVVYDITDNIVRYGIWFDEELSETWYDIKQGDSLTASFNSLTGVFSVGDIFAYSGTELTEKNRSSLEATFSYDALNDEWYSQFLGLDAERK